MLWLWHRSCLSLAARAFFAEPILCLAGRSSFGDPILSGYNRAFLSLAGRVSSGQQKVCHFTFSPWQP